MHTPPIAIALLLLAFAAARAEAAEIKALIKFLTTPAAKAVFRSKGMDVS